MSLRSGLSSVEIAEMEYTFHLDLNDYTCGISINGINYGIIWANLPRNENL